MSWDLESLSSNFCASKIPSVAREVAALHADIPTLHRVLPADYPPLPACVPKLLGTCHIPKRQEILTG